MYTHTHTHTHTQVVLGQLIDMRVGYWVGKLAFSPRTVPFIEEFPDAVRSLTAGLMYGGKGVCVCLCVYVCVCVCVCVSLSADLMYGGKCMYGGKGMCVCVFVCVCVCLRAGLIYAGKGHTFSKSTLGTPCSLTTISKAPHSENTPYSIFSQ